MTKRRLAGTAVLSFVVLAALFLGGIRKHGGGGPWERTEFSRAKRAANPAAPRVASSRQTVAASGMPSPDEHAIPSQPESRPSAPEPRSTPVEAPVQESTDSLEANGLQKMVLDVAAWVEDPEAKDMMRAHMGMALEHTYASLFRYLRLTPERLDAFEGLLVEKAMAQLEIGADAVARAVSGEATDSTADEKGKRLLELTRQCDDRIRAFLGEADYEVYKEYEETQPERMQVEEFQRALGADDQLSDEQMHCLIVAMHETRTDLLVSTGLDEEHTLDPASFAGETTEQVLAQLEQLNAGYVARARPILSDAQLMRFESWREKRLTAERLQVSLVTQLFAGSAE
ncbi:MAG: hypothetical protein JXR37_26360 [Kiritimatiellae bacterium]|nr:hypothetical protein [Kiritimatiellia bacterium]